MSLPILGNISCYHAGCTNSVVGQCQGYPGHCGRFYCAEHSRSEHPKGVLCLECAQRLAKDREEQERKEIQERLLQLYFDAAEQVPRISVFVLLLGWLPLYIIFVCILTLLRTSENSAAVISLLLALIIVILHSSWKYMRAKKKQITELSKVLPNFDKFYEKWLEHRQEKENKDILLAFFVTSIAVAATAAARERRISEIEEGVRRALK